jgi:glycosyltransferase involved in cell wall biosynthesis
MDKNMKPGKVNIVIPIFNQESYIRECLNSALNQTYKNYDITIVNDGSDDRSLEVINETIDIYLAEDNRKRTEFQDKVDRHKLDATAAGQLYREYFPNGERKAPKVISRENRGLSESRNEGIQAGDGEFILPLDSDDFISLDYLEKTVPLMADSKVGVVSTDMQYFGLLTNRIPPRGLTLQHEMKSNDLPVCSLIRRKAFEETKGYATLFVEIAGEGKAPGYEDWELFLSLLERGWQVAVVNEPLFHYRIRSGTMISKAVKAHDGLVKLIHLLHPNLWPQA